MLFISLSQSVQGFRSEREPLFQDNPISVSKAKMLIPMDIVTTDGDKLEWTVESNGKV